ncbi:DNA lyase-like protein [Saccharata proteae CBS 121410]|uniref:DNA-(apurinic or apyrimidinic site) endonuclease 2 n=1 Tax=Saccharata proteae CBS 121410 TaxID=1314787 RepID=A0A9P4HYP7_9PEZI|nr:DNA lyase-like protein [Saccharata proteae CBS 121410]
MPLRITTWNVNGIRNPFGYQPWREHRSFAAMFDLLEADIVVMQELKIQRKDLRDDMVLVPGWDCFFSLPKHKKGYSGVAVYTRQSVCAPIRAEEGILGVLCPPGSSTPYCKLPPGQSIGGYPSQHQLTSIGVDPAALDAEGRCVIVEFPAFVLFGVYSPANSNGLRDDFRLGFLSALDTRIRNLDESGKQVILTGDLNVSREAIDSANAEDSMRKEGLTNADYISTPNRRLFNQLLAGGQVIAPRDEGREEPVLWDTCRELHPGRKGMYTHWEQKINARPGNFGSRIDYVLCSIVMKDWICEADIQEGLMGSDHCPVFAIFKDKVGLNGREFDLLDMMNPQGMFEGGARKRPYSAKDVLAFSGRAMPEFDKRRSIKDMFAQKSSSLAKSTSAASNLEEPRGSNHTKAPERAADPSQSKRKRTSDTGAASKAPTKGQKTLKSFFRPSESPSVHNEPPALPKSPEPFPKPHKASQESTSPRTTAHRDVAAGPSHLSKELSSTAGYDRPAAFVDPIASKESWSKLFSRPNPPRCEGHNEPCVDYKTRKSGFNCGRTFWMCPRPLGPSGNKETNSEWRCHTFIWASDWMGKESE